MNSPLVEYIALSPHSGSRNGNNIDLITIHCMAGNLSVESCAHVFQSVNDVRSSNYGIGSDGRVGVYVNESDRSFCSSSSANDSRAVTIEVANDTLDPDYHCTDAAMAKLVLLCTDICRRNGIANLTFNADDKSHPTNPTGNMTLHKWFKNKACPGPYLESNMSKIANEVNMLLQSGATSYTWDTATASGDITNVSISNPVSSSNINGSSVDISKFTPFVVTVDPSVRKINYDDLKKLQASGMLFEAGSLYDTQHNEKVYRNANLLKQVKDCNKAGLRFGLYSIVRSRNLAEAKKECIQLYYTISKYPPGLGLWLKLEFIKSQSKTRNHKILDYYYEQIENWGLKQGCGLYCGKDQLDLIDWDTYKDKFLLWYINMFTSEEQFNQVQQMITPEFFHTL